MLMIGERLRTIRESKNLSQGDVEKRTGMLRCYTSRVENGHTIPSIETLAKYAQALEIPLYQLFYDGEEAPKKIKGLDLDGEKLSLGERREIESLGRKFAKLKERDKGLSASSSRSLRRPPRKTPLRSFIVYCRGADRSGLNDCHSRICSDTSFFSRSPVAFSHRRRNSLSRPSTNPTRPDWRSGLSRLPYPMFRLLPFDFRISLFIPPYHICTERIAPLREG